MPQVVLDEWEAAQKDAAPLLPVALPSLSFPRQEGDFCCFELPCCRTEGGSAGSKNAVIAGPGNIRTRGMLDFCSA